MEEGHHLPEEHVGLYRPRRPRDSSLYRLVDACYDEVKGRWEEDFERRYKVITLLRDEGLLSHERIELLMSWRHSGFSAHFPRRRLRRSRVTDAGLSACGESR